MVKKSFFKVVLSILLTVSIAVVMLPSAAYANTISTAQKLSAQTISNPTPQPDDQTKIQAQVQSLKSQKEKFDQAIRLMEAHIKVNSTNELTIDVKTGSELGIDEGTFNTLKAGMEQTNARLRSGDLKLSDVHFASKNQISFAGNTIANTVCAGRNAVYIYWWGFELYINECITQAIEGLLWVGAGVTAICSLIAGVLGGVPVFVICGVAAGLATIGAGALQAIDGLGGNRGIIIDTNLVGQINSVWHQ